MDSYGKRKWSVSVCLTEIRGEDATTAIFEKLVEDGWMAGKVEAVQRMGANTMRIRLTTEEYFREFLKRYERGMGTRGKILPVMRADRKTSFVNVMEAPFGITKEEVLGELTKYGEVESIRMGRWQQWDIPNGTWHLRMYIKKDIPSYIEIEGERVIITYPGQIQTCRVCGQKGHMSYQCKRKNNYEESAEDKNEEAEKEQTGEIEGRDAEKKTADETMGWEKQRRRKRTTGNRGWEKENGKDNEAEIEQQNGDKKPGEMEELAQKEKPEMRQEVQRKVGIKDSKEGTQRPDGDSSENEENTELVIDLEAPQEEDDQGLKTRLRQQQANTKDGKLRNGKTREKAKNPDNRWENAKD